MTLVSRNADFHPPLIERVRKDWRHVPLVPTQAPLTSYVTEILRGIGIGLFVLIVFVGMAVL